MHMSPRIRRLLFLVGAFSSLVIASPATSSAKSDLDRFELVGSVRTVVTRHPQLKTTHQFDHNGNLTSLELVPTKEASTARYVYLHDAAGRLTEEHTVEPDGTLTNRKQFRYGVDEEGRQLALVAATEEGLFAHAEFSLYDGRGLLAEQIVVSGQGIAEKSLYDVEGNLLYHARYFQGRLVLEATHHYGPLGRLKESRFYGSDGELMRKDFYRYDQSGNRVEQTSEFYHQSRLRKSVVTYEFDHMGNWTKETIQRWSDKNGGQTLGETVVSRERTITYY
jgi:hypothetical protein